LRGRLGVAAEKAMFYGTGGLAFANISHTITISSSGAPRQRRPSAQAGPRASA
jgi:opacity protein-like surface antigen